VRKKTDDRIIRDVTTMTDRQATVDTMTTTEDLIGGGFMIADVFHGVVDVGLLGGDIDLMR